jgi:hypothetical protein
MKLLYFVRLLFIISCKNDDKKVISNIGLKRGDLISCGPPDKEFGEVGFESPAPKR